MLDAIDPRRAPTPTPPCPRCGNPQTLELQVTLAVAGVRWFDCHACKRVFSKPGAVSQEDAATAGRVPKTG